MALNKALIATGFYMALLQTAAAAGMNAPAGLLPPGFAPATETPAAAMSGYAPALGDDAERSGTGEAELMPNAMPNTAPIPTMAIEGDNQGNNQGSGQADYIDVPALAPMESASMSQVGPQAGSQTSYTQGITTGSKAYNEGNFTFRGR